jgi:signal recognition particle receptor subunit beta
MASLNPLTREVVFKIVFYGPGLGGKTTTLQHIHTASKPEHRGKMVSLATPMDRTLYFDFLPLRMPLVNGMHVRLQLFTVPGQVYFGATRKLVLTGADGVVFVADSQVGRQDANQESLEDLVMNLAENNLSLLSLPHTFHWNKRDLPDIVPIADLDRTLNRQGAPSIGTVATSGDGVFSGLERITRLVFQAYQAELPKPEASKSDRAPAERPPIEETTIEDALRGLAEAPSRSRVAPVESGPSFKGPPASVRGSALASSQVSSLESIPNPIPRRPNTTPDGSPNSSPASTNVAGPQSSRMQTAASRSGGPHATPAGGTEPIRQQAPVPTPQPPWAASAALAGLSPSQLPLSREVEEITDETLEGFRTSPPPKASATPASFSFGLLWGEADRDVAGQAESALASGDSVGAVLACDILVNRLIASAAGLAGSVDAPRDPGLLVVLLGIDGKRYLAFKVAVRGARAQEKIPMPGALEAYAFALDVRRALAAVGI